jgi:hypothetical protein
MSIFTVPVVHGGGKKLFADGSAPHSRNSLDSPSDREVERREQLKREG